MYIYIYICVYNNRYTKILYLFQRTIIKSLWIAAQTISSRSSNLPHIYYSMNNKHFFSRTSLHTDIDSPFRRSFTKKLHLFECNYILLTCNQIWGSQLSLHVIISYVCAMRSQVHINNHQHIVKWKTHAHILSCK